MFNFQRDLTVSIGGTNYVAEVTEIHVESRYEVSAGISPQIEIPYATITLSTAANLQPKLPVIISVTTLAAYRNTTRWPGAVTIFRGEIDQVNETVTPFGLRVLEVIANNPIKKLLGGKVDSLTLSSAHSPETRARYALAAANADNWPSTAPAVMINPLGIGSGAQMPNETLTDTQTGDMIQQALDCEAGAIVTAYWDTTADDVFYWWPRGSYTVNTGTPAPGNTLGFSSYHANTKEHWCTTEVVTSKDTITHYNYISASLQIDPTTKINPTSYAACKNNTSIGYYGVVPLDISLNFYKPAANPTQHLKAWVSSLNLTRPARRVESVTAIANMRDGYVNGYLVDPYWLMSGTGEVNVTLEKTYPGTVNKSFSVNDIYYCSGQIHDITPTSWFVRYELWKGY